MNTAAQPGAAADPPRSNPIATGYLLGDSDKHKLGGFLEHCHHCGKRIANNSDVFMYGDLRGFCSAACRDCKMAGDRSAAKKRQAILKEKK